MRWPPFKHVFFDCDSTLTSVEGIDVLADSAGKGWRVSVLTRAAMDGDLELQQVYRKRLQTLRPTRGQIQRLRQLYKQNVVEDARQVINALQGLGHQVYIVSGGLEDAVIEFGRFLGVPRPNIRAVPIRYDQLAGDWWQQDERDQPNLAERYLAYGESALTISDGKAQSIRELIGDQEGRSLLIGDGSSDLLAGSAVDLFVGYGGVVARPQVQAKAPAFIHSPSLAPLLLLAAGPVALQTLRQTPFQSLAEKSLSLIATGAISFQDERHNQKFNQAYQAVHTRTHGSSA